MFSCLIIRGEDIQGCTRKQILISLLQHKDYEIYEHNFEQTIIFIWNEVRQVIWQYVYQLEFSKFEVGYGFGQNKEEAIKKAELIFEKRQHLSKK